MTALTSQKSTAKFSSDCVKFLYPTRHEIGYFRDVRSSQSFAPVLKNKIKQASITKYTTTQNGQEKLKPGSAAIYNIQPGNRMGLLLLLFIRIKKCI